MFLFQNNTILRHFNNFNHDLINCGYWGPIFGGYFNKSWEMSSYSVFFNEII